MNRPGNFTRVMTLLHRVQTDVYQTIRDGFLKVAIVVVFSPSPGPNGAFVIDVFITVYQKRAQVQSVQ